VQRSSDRGNTWSDPVTVEGPLGSNVRFAPLRLDDGTLLLPAYEGLIHILYSHNRRTIGHITCNEAWIAAAD